MTVKPWDLLKKENWTDGKIALARMNECRACDRLIQSTTTCRECGCFMVAKTKLKEAECPLGKW
jgi:hypothetical protein